MAYYTTNNPSSTPPPKPLRILLLHGYTQNPTLFRAKTGFLQKALTKTFPPNKYTLHLSYPAGPHKLAPADIPGFRAEELDVSAAE
ncbi:MAG: hypothetical protein Q9164_006979, partial [Protoblastenia rupestris]